MSPSITSGPEYDAADAVWASLAAAAGIGLTVFPAQNVLYASLSFAFIFVFWSSGSVEEAGF